MKTRRWQTVGILAVMTLTLFSFTSQALADEVGDAAGVEKETMFSLIEKGGYIMYPLALGSILALALGLERFVALRKQRILPAGFIDGLMTAWSADASGKQAVKYCDEAGGASGHIFKAGIRRAKMGPEAVEKARDWMHQRRKEFENDINEQLNQHLNALGRLRKKQHRQLELQFEGSRQHGKTVHSLKEQKRRSIDKIFDEYLNWIEDTMTTEDNPYIQVISVFKG
jgi:hypothetical protein